jgi:histidinol-phosphate aminotransferase
MHHLFSAFGGPGRTAISFDPTYSMYPEYARDTFTRYEHVPRRADFGLDMDAAMAAVDDLRPSLVIVSSPNNPTGTACGPESLEALANRAGAYGGLLVVDEAYAEFRAPGRSSACELVGGQPNLVVVRTMSKAFAMAGLRLGYALAGDRSIVDAMRIVRLPYHLSALTQTAARVAIERAELLQWQLASIRAERDRLTGWLEERDLSPAPSDANFVFFGPFDDAEAVWHGLLEHGVLIRRTGPAGWLRVTIGTPEENGRFREALSAVLEGST